MYLSYDIIGFLTFLCTLFVFYRFIEPLSFKYSIRKPINNQNKKEENKVSPVSEDFVWDESPGMKSYPFKGSEYKLTMAIKKSSKQDWLRIEPTYKDRIEERKKLIFNTHSGYPKDKNLRSSTLFYSKEADFAIHELYDMVVEYMTAKYPKYFSREGDSVQNTITGEIFPYTSKAETSAVTCLETLAQIAEEDFIILLKDSSRSSQEHGDEYFFKGGLFTFASGFDPAKKFNKPLTSIHDPVPGYESKLKLSMNRFFDRLSPGQFIERSNFSVQTHNRLYIDDMNKGHNTPSLEQKPISIDALDFETQVHYRSERQTLTRLPKSGAVIFTIKTYLEPISVLKNEPKEVRERFIRTIEGLPAPIAAYKRAYEWGPAVIQYLKD